MSTIPKIRSKETEMTSLESHKKISSKKLPAKDIISNIQTSIIIDPIDPKRISKVFLTNGLSVSSVVKAGVVFLGTIGSYYLVKTTGIFSYFEWGTRNSKDLDNSEIMEVKKTVNSLTVRKSLETIRQVDSSSTNQIVQTYKDDRTIAFKEIKIEEFKNLLEVEKEKNVGKQKSFGRRSIVVQNPIPNQNVTVGKPFNLTIDGTYVFNSSGALFLEATNIPTWLNSINLNPTFKGSYDTPALVIAVSGNYAYLAETTCLFIIDISNPSNPTFKGSYDTPDQAEGVALSGNYAYVAN